MAQPSADGADQTERAAAGGLVLRNRQASAPVRVKGHPRQIIAYVGGASCGFVMLVSPANPVFYS